MKYSILVLLLGLVSCGPALNNPQQLLNGQDLLKLNAYQLPYTLTQSLLVVVPSQIKTSSSSLTLVLGNSSCVYNTGTTRSYLTLTSCSNYQGNYNPTYLVKVNKNSFINLQGSDGTEELDLIGTPQNE